MILARTLEQGYCVPVFHHTRHGPVETKTVKRKQHIHTIELLELHPDGSFWLFKQAGKITGQIWLQIHFTYSCRLILNFLCPLALEDKENWESPWVKFTWQSSRLWPVGLLMRPIFMPGRQPGPQDRWLSSLGKCTCTLMINCYPLQN